MSIAASLHTSALGIHRYIERFNAGAAQAARPSHVGRVQPMVDMMIAEHGTQANINAFKSAAHLSRALLDIMA